ncbi:YiiX/YebB-like N1pC/P60 family cysteine hydrolase [Asticcacaulis sp. BYS171W]|uniref:YiiX/YebB-like N1pC/P60 family cysteine hydrolase n=1 Tax=Asticcacaulis aquaticus TaxID=2984212 RepID=A0ABT5HQQ3_9CAUL|nr:YiiX/YebB-like N1pC/P60 family cysteine hydrolase [Asticcacaulis aquaticus]MDC7682397.1 YiiX/YebB-like N1pC/P60 family cysteine hydrolase [Asticcacaulis aquaticus]
MGKIWKVVGLILCIGLAVSVWRWNASTPEWRDGDLIFQTSRSQQSKAILLASRSLYTHMGIVKRTPDGWVVVEAVGPVKETPLKAWVARGKFARYAVYRPKRLTEAQTRKVFAAAKALYGRPYDIYFSFDNRSIYCSELAYLVFKPVGIELGQRQPIGQLGVGEGAARKLIAQRAAKDPDCKGLSPDACIARIMSRELVTPVSIARDAEVRKIYSNYPI